jgi:hypothetical protein
MPNKYISTLLSFTLSDNQGDQHVYCIYIVCMSLVALRANAECPVDESYHNTKMHLYREKERLHT